MGLNKDSIKESVQKNKSPEVLVEFVPNPNFKEEFLEFVETVISWSELEKENKS